MKDEWTEAVCAKLARGGYSTTSTLFQGVKKSLGKLSTSELVNLYTILSTLPMCQCPEEDKCG